jgi:hypothetical protein
MNQSIYLMVSVPYLVLGLGGFLVYRGCKKNAEYLKRLDRPHSQHPGADHVEHPSSRVPPS